VRLGEVRSLLASLDLPLDVNLSDPHWKEAFISPRDSFGVLIQLAEFDEEYWADRMASSRPGGGPAL